MRKALILVTRPMKEFHEYWCAPKEMINGTNVFMPLQRAVNDRTVIIISPANFGFEADEADFWEKIQLVMTISAADLSGAETGIAIHVPEPYIPQHVTYGSLAFAANYSSSEGGRFCEQAGENFVAAGDPGVIRKGVLDVFRDALVFDRPERLVAAFDELWDYFSRDQTLEARLELLTACLTKEGLQNVVLNGNVITTEKNGGWFSVEAGTAGAEAFAALQTAAEKGERKDYTDALRELRKLLIPDPETETFE